jgi:hypothetical protein
VKKPEGLEAQTTSSIQPGAVIELPGAKPPVGRGVVVLGMPLSLPGFIERERVLAEPP